MADIGDVASESGLRLSRLSLLSAKAFDFPRARPPPPPRRVQSRTNRFLLRVLARFYLSELGAKVFNFPRPDLRLRTGLSSHLRACLCVSA
jgi:hypothetical protein